MKIIKIVLWIVPIILLQPLLAFAQSSQEISINDLYKKAYSIVYERLDVTNLPNVDNKKAPEAVNCILEIYKRKPDSLEAYYSTFLLKYIIKTRLSEKYEEMKDKHLANLNDPNFETGEKLIFLWLIASQWMHNVKLEEGIDNESINNVLISIRDNCKNKSYSVLAAAMLSDVPLLALENLKKIIEIAPEHPAVPYVMAEIISIENKNDPQKCIREIQILINKFGNIETPSGWRMVYEYYFFIAYVYVDVKDHENAKKYYEIIQKEAPDFCNLICLKTALDYINQ